MRSAAVFVASVYLWGGVMIIALNAVVLGAVDVCVCLTVSAVANAVIVI